MVGIYDELFCLGNAFNKTAYLLNSKGKGVMAGKDLLDIEMIETAALLSALSERAVCNLQQEFETGEKWREKNLHQSRNH